MDRAFKVCRTFGMAISLMAIVVSLVLPLNLRAQESGEDVHLSQYANRQLLSDFTAAPCPDNPRALTQLNGNLYRHTTGLGWQSIAVWFSSRKRGHSSLIR